MFRSLLALIAAAPAAIRAGMLAQPAPVFKKAPKTYGAMPFDADEVYEWNAKVRMNNALRGKKRL